MIFTHDTIRIAFKAESSSFSVMLGNMALRPCTSQVVLQDGTREEVVWKTGRAVRDGLILRGHAAGGRWILRVTGVTNARGVRGVQLDLSGTAGRPLVVSALNPLILLRLRADHVLVHGRSAGGCGALVPSAGAKNFSSHLLLMVRQGQTILQIAQPLRQDRPSLISGVLKRSFLRELSVSTPFSGEEGVGLLHAEPVSLFVDTDGHGLMEAWAEAQTSIDVTSPVEPVAGWNSWDYFRWTITEEDVLRNAAFIAADPVLSRHVRRIIIDDGWQYAYGEWDANPLFPHGMDWMAKRLNRLGFEPGLWMAPGIVEPHARIAQWNSDMLACGVSGLPCLCFNCMQRQGFVLDPTVPKTQQWLHDLFSRYAQMGYKYFKLDFLLPVTQAPCFSDVSVPRGKIVQKLLEPAHRALKGRARIMGCGYDFHAGMEVVDEVRTSSDIHARWDSIQKNVGSIAARWWAQGRWWGNDPDFSLARGPETSGDPDLRRLKPCLVFVKPQQASAPIGDYVLATQSLAEARTLLSLVVISGGAVNLSDDLTRLNEAGLDLLRRPLAAPRGAAGVALDLFTTARPAQWLQRLREGWRVLLINWADEPREISLNLRAIGVDAGRGRNFWTDDVLRVRDGVLSQALPPHACVLAEFLRQSI